MYSAELVNLCPNQTFDQMITIKYVIDGDTVITADNKHIRLIGIDTPEINYITGANDTGADAAKNYLTALLKGAGEAGMVFDKEKYDQYGRTLAHLYLKDGTNIQAELLGQGLAVPLTYPPNLKNTRCYYHASDLAREQQRGLWGYGQYQPINAENLSDTDRGFKIVYGSLNRIVESKRSLSLHVSDSFIATIRTSDLILFKSKDINGSLGNQIQVQGELYQRNGNFWMSIRHPQDLKILSAIVKSSDIK